MSLWVDQNYMLVKRNAHVIVLHASRPLHRVGDTVPEWLNRSPVVLDVPGSRELGCGIQGMGNWGS